MRATGDTAATWLAWICRQPAAPLAQGGARQLQRTAAAAAAAPSWRHGQPGAGLGRLRACHHFPPWTRSRKTASARPAGAHQVRLGRSRASTPPKPLQGCGGGSGHRPEPGRFRAAAVRPAGACRRLARSRARTPPAAQRARCTHKPVKPGACGCRLALRLTRCGLRPRLGLCGVNLSNEQNINIDYSIPVKAALCAAHTALTWLGLQLTRLAVSAMLRPAARSATICACAFRSGGRPL